MTTEIDSTIASLRQALCSEDIALGKRFRALFSLKHLAKESSSLETADAAVEAIAAGFVSPSALLKHELAYCLGQSGRKTAVVPLRTVLQDLDEDPMCRHEAAEGLAALGDLESLELLKRFRDREGEEVVVKETCEIAVDRIEWQHSVRAKTEHMRQSNFASVDPAPPMPEAKQTVDELEATLMNASLPLFLRYRAMFTLRDLASPPNLTTAVPAVLALAKGFADSSALFRHEIAYVFGQLSHPASIPALAATLGNPDEVGMVRHEAAEALGSLGDEEGVEEILKRFIGDKEQVVHESVVVALDMAEYEKGGEVEYALIPEPAKASA